MTHNGSHLICEEHLEETEYCCIEKKWLCISCSLKEKFSFHSPL